MNPNAIRTLDRAALALSLVLPAFIMHGRAVAEVMLALVDILFLARSALARDWSWLGARWVKFAAAWWLWQAFCSLPFVGIGGWHSFIQALVVVRYLVFAAALEHAVLATARARRWMQGAFAVATLYIMAQTWKQFLTGTNFQGIPRYPDGALSGPFYLPRAGAPLARILFPTFVPWIARLLEGGPAARIAAVLLAILALGTEVLIGQRMPTLLTLLGFAAAALLMPRLHRVVAAAFVAGAVLLAATPVISPPTFYRLVTKFSAQMENFPDSDYGLIFTRAVIITADHPILGRGFDGYRNACPDPVYFRATGFQHSHPDGGGAKNCNIHPHNHYLEAATNAGLPGLALFGALMFVLLREMLRGLGARPDPVRVGLFAGALVHVWPISSMSGFPAMDLTGFFFLTVGYGLALARAASSTAATSPAASRPST